MMKVQAVTDVGRERSVNQDYVYYSLTETGSLPNLFLVADGMGGHKAVSYTHLDVYKRQQCALPYQRKKRQNIWHCMKRKMPWQGCGC